MEKGGKEAKKANATIVFADEAGIQMNSNLRRTWAPRGKTPILKQVTRSYRKISAMGAIAVTPKGRRSRLFFRLLENKNFNTEACICFIEQLKQNIRGQIVLVWDRLLAHRSKRMAAYLSKQRRVKLVFLPAYAPELNPVEFLWSYLKNNKLCNKPHYDLGNLNRSTKKAICEIRKEKALTKSFIKHSRLAKALSL